MDGEQLAALRALVDATRLRIVARLAAGPADAGSLAAELKEPLPAINRHLETLEAAGLVERRPGRPERYGARLRRVGELGRMLADLERSGGGPARDPGEGGRVSGPGGAWPHEGETLAATLARLDPDPAEAKTLRAFLADGRLVAIPAQVRKRQIVLRFLLERVFDEDRDYPEKEVNQRLALFHPDVASLRRYLVDEGYVTRSAGIYRRRTARSSEPARDD